MPRYASHAVEPFTWAAFASYLDAALTAGYLFADYDSALDAGDWRHAQFILLRHDIDYDPRWVEPISRIESERGVRATFFFQPSAAYYQLDDVATDGAIRGVLAAGHRLGLHFDATCTSDDAQVIEEVERTARLWERKYDTPIAAVSFHMPTHRRVDHLRLDGGRINTYSDTFLPKLAYVSDSNQDWRGKDLMHVLTVERPRALQLLTHPIWWRERYTPLLHCLQELADRLHLSVERDMLTPEQHHLLKQRAGAA